MKHLPQAKAATKKHVILFLAANPRDTDRRLSIVKHARFTSSSSAAAAGIGSTS